ncbi:hypothetical protein KKH18_13115 [bacterium]|nr:hypothetical protein [bacterium]
MKTKLLAEVFGFPPESKSKEAKRHRELQFCPFNNSGPNCTKDKKDNPLGVCSIWHNEKTSIVCPIRFRENWIVAEHAAGFLFPKGSKWTYLPEIRLFDANDENIGKIDYVLVSYDSNGIITHYGALEIQAVYISGNLRTPFEKFCENPEKNTTSSFDSLVSPPHPDNLSSRKRLIPQLFAKGRIFRRWGRKMAVAVDSVFYDSLPKMQSVPVRTADLAWFVYELVQNKNAKTLSLKMREVVYTDLRDTLSSMMEPAVGEEGKFLSKLQGKLNTKLLSK